MPVNDCLIANLIVPLQDERIAYCYGRQISRQDAVPVERFARLFNYPEWPLVKGKDDIRRLGIKAFFCSNACSAVKRREFEDMGGFLEGLIMNEDMFFAAKVIMNGYQIAYEPSAAVYHSHNYSLLNQFKRYFDIGAAIGSNGLLLDMAEAEGEGARFIKEGMRYLAQEGQSKWIPYFLIQGFLKYCGYCLGLKEKALPAGIKRCLSMHKQYWLKRKL
jgi:rhamnosyltransferase